MFFLDINENLKNNALNMNVQVTRRSFGGRKWNLIYFINFVETFKKKSQQSVDKKENRNLHKRLNDKHY